MSLGGAYAHRHKRHLKQSKVVKRHYFSKIDARSQSINLVTTETKLYNGAEKAKFKILSYGRLKLSIKYRNQIIKRFLKTGKGQLMTSLITQEPSKQLASSDATHAVSRRNRPPTLDWSITPGNPQLRQVRGQTTSGAGGIKKSSRANPWPKKLGKNTRTIVKDTVNTVPMDKNYYIILYVQYWEVKPKYIINVVTMPKSLYQHPWQ